MLIRCSHWVVCLQTLWGLVVALSPTLPQQDINTINCFDLVDESQWDLVLGLNLTTASLSVVVSGAGPPVITCLNRQTVRYLVSVVGDTNSQPFLLSDMHTWEGVSAKLVKHPPTFPYLIYGGRYRLQFTHCGTMDTCTEGQGTKTVFSDFVNIQSSVNPWCSPSQFTGNTSLLSMDTPAVQGTTTVFHFSYTPCSTVQPYDKANVTLYSAETREECGKEVTTTKTVEIYTNTAGEAAILYQSPELPGDMYYCLSVTLSHISCRLTTLERPTHCWLESDAVWVPATPFIASILPFCTSHFACMWLYIVLGGSFSLIVSLVMAILCVRCCERRDRDGSKHGDVVDFPGEVISLAPLSDRRSWAELHKEWESREEKARGKILLLYSPDTKLFKELQEAFKSFLDLACHCDIYDLFDDALFDTIALDPSEWLQEFVNDKDVKIVVISSIGAYRRQLALKGEMPLNLPDNSLLDGLFTSGLRFVSSHPGLTTSGRVATARYEMLHLTEEGHKLGPPVGCPNTREFLIPTQLHELFCWVHQLKPLDLMGKPWSNYHLEMQLLQDALKLVRRDRTVMTSSGAGQPNFTDLGNGVTMI